MSNTLKPIPEVLVREKNAIGTSSQWSKSDELTTADNISRGVDYFYADPEWRLSVAIACIRVLFDFNAEKFDSVLIDEGDALGEYETARILFYPFN